MRPGCRRGPNPKRKMLVTSGRNPIFFRKPRKKKIEGLDPEPKQTAQTAVLGLGPMVPGFSNFAGAVDLLTKGLLAQATGQVPAGPLHRARAHQWLVDCLSTVSFHWPFPLALFSSCGSAPRL